MFMIIKFDNGYRSKVFPPNPWTPFCAMTAAYFTLKKGPGLPDKGREAMSQLEKAPMAIYFPDHGEQTLTHYTRTVKSYDRFMDIAGSKCNKAKTVTHYYLKEPYVVYHYDGNDYLDELNYIAVAATRLGRSFASFSFQKDPPDFLTRLNNLYLSQGGAAKSLMDVPAPGSLEESEAYYQAGTLLTAPYVARYDPWPQSVGGKIDKQLLFNGTVKPALPRHRLQTVYQEFVSFRIQGGSFDITQGAHISHAVRQEVVKLCDDSPDPACLVGKDESIHHAAYVPLSNVGNSYANGRIMGIAVAVPFTEQIDECMGVIQRLTGFTLGSQTYELIPTKPNKFLPCNMLPQTWNMRRFNRVFATVTPVEIRHSNRGNIYTNKEAYETACEEIIKHCREDLELPDIKGIELRELPYFRGSQPARSFVSRNSIVGRRPGFRVHCMIEFMSWVRGFVTIGRGRNFALGNMRPW